MSKKIVITNIVTLNTGDAAILQGTIKTARAAFGTSVDIVVIERSAEAASKYYPDLKFKQVFLPDLSRGRLARILSQLSRGGLLGRSMQRKKLMLASQYSLLGFLLPPKARHNLEEMHSADLIISTGGTYLVPHYDITANLIQLLLARQSGKPVVMFTQSLGPFPTRTLASVIRKVVSSMSLILLRDERSRRHLIDVGADVSKALVVPDAAFVLADEERLISAAKRSMSERLKFAVSVREWKFPGSASPGDASERYFDAIRAAVSHLVSVHGASVTFLSTCQGVAEYWTDDSATADAIVSALPETVRQHVVVDRDYHGPEQLVDMLAGFDAVIATRMHMAILALCGGTPVLAIAYEFKTRELFESLGCGDWVQDIDSVSPESICGFVDRFLSALTDRREALMAATLEQHRSALGIAKQLRGLLPG